MKYTSSDLAIIIPITNKKNVKKILFSIKKQTKKPGQTLFIFNSKTNFKSEKKIIFAHSKISNQVYQRNLGLKLINKKIKLILQLDDKFYLHKKAIENLIDEWNSLADNVAGIGIKSNFEYENVNKFKFLKYISLTVSNKPGKVLISGFNNKIISSKKFIDVDWLQGGLSSWKLKHIPNIFKRKFPLLKWSILEDLIFSYDVKNLDKRINKKRERDAVDTPTQEKLKNQWDWYVYGIDFGQNVSILDMKFYGEHSGMYLYAYHIDLLKTTVPNALKLSS